MANNIYEFDPTAANNSTTGGVNAAEGQLPSTVNDASRQNKALIAQFIDDLGGINTAIGGTADAITVTIKSGVTAYADGLIFAVSYTTGPNTGATTMNVNSIGVKKVRRQGDTALVAADMLDNGIYLFRYASAYDGGTGAFVLLNPAQPQGLGTGDSPQFTAVNIGHASDTTLTRASPGDVLVEGNIVYRAGGTDVAVADGGMGGSTAAAARTNLAVLGTAGGTMTGQLTITQPAAATIGPALEIWNATDGRLANLLSLIHYGSAGASFGPYTADTCGLDGYDAVLNVGTQSVHALQLYTSNTVRFTLSAAGGLFALGATGGDKGDGTINAVGVYDDNSLLVCFALQEEFFASGSVDMAYWDSLVPDTVIPGTVNAEKTELDPVMVDVEEEVEEDIPITSGVHKGALRRRREVKVVRRQATRAVSVYNANGKEIDVISEPVFEERIIPRRVVPEQRIKRRHELAHQFKAMIDGGFDPRDPVSYIAKLKADGGLPGMPNRATWQHNTMSQGELFMRLWLASELLALQVIGLHERVSALEAA